MGIKTRKTVAESPDLSSGDYARWGRSEPARRSIEQSCNDRNWTWWI